MNRNIFLVLTAIVVGPGFFLAMPLMAQTPSGSSSQNVASRHHKPLYQLMNDMTGEMGKMTEQMSHDLTPEQRDQMAKRMEAMSSMMHRMSGLEAMPAMLDTERQKQMNEMRKQMDEMMNAPAMKPGPK